MGYFGGKVRLLQQSYFGVFASSNFQVTIIHCIVIADDGGKRVIVHKEVELSYAYLWSTVWLN